MDLFLLNEAKPTTLPTKVLAIAAAGFFTLYALSKFFSQDDKENEPSDSQQRELKKPAGIYNQGNTCFVNSLLQALASLKSFQDNLAEVVSQFKSRPDKEEELLLELSAVMDKINGNSQSISVQHLLQLINEVKEGLINLEQQDAHELYAAIVGCFQSALNKQKRVDLSSSAKFDRPQEEMIENRLMGFTKSSITCTSCNNQTAIKIHPFYDLSLEVRPHYVVDIRTALLEFQREERIESWTCTSCTIHRHTRRLRAAMKGLKGPNKDQLTFVGEAIIEHLERSDNLQDDIGEVNQNLADFVHTYLQAYQKMEGDPQRDMIFVEMEGVQTTITKKTVITKYPKILVIHLKQLVINPLTGEPQLLRKHIGFEESLAVRVKGGEKKYQLTSLLTHIGNESMGHYFTFRRESRNSQNWFMISDSCSKRCQWDYVRASRAYILFFEAD